VGSLCGRWTGREGVLVICCAWLSARVVEGAPAFKQVRSPAGLWVSSAVDRRLTNHRQKSEYDVHIEAIQYEIKLDAKFEVLLHGT
jgi:hypothetical protein